MALIIHAQDGKSFVPHGTYLNMEMIYVRMEILFLKDGTGVNVGMYVYQDEEAYFMYPEKHMCVDVLNPVDKTETEFIINYDFKNIKDANLSETHKLLAEELTNKGFEVEVVNLMTKDEVHDKNPSGAIINEHPLDKEKKWKEVLENPDEEVEG